MSSPYRGFAAVTHDTNRIAEVITELNALNTTVSGKLSTSHANSDGHPGIYSPSALAYYLEVANDGAGSSIQTIGTASWTTINVGGTVATNNGGGTWNSSSDEYTIPAGGVYVSQALVRVEDSVGASFNLGLGVHTSNVDGYWFQWNKYVTGGGGRCAFDYTRVCSFGVGNQVRLYCFQDSGSNKNLWAAQLAIYRIG